MSMGCNCGGFTVTTTERRKRLVLRYERCGACGRCDDWKLTDGDNLVMTGEEARRAYRDRTVGNTSGILL